MFTPHDGLLSASGEVQLLLLLHQGLPDAAAMSVPLRLGHGETQLRAPRCGQVLQQCETRVTGNVTMGLPRQDKSQRTAATEIWYLCCTFN